MRGEESLDLRQHVPMLLDVEEEVAALARAEEVLILRDMRQQRAPAARTSWRQRRISCGVLP